MLNGFWTVSFKMSDSEGAGVLTVVDGDATGGDSSFTYVGKLTASPDGELTGTLEINQFNQALQPFIPGLANYNLHVTGKISGDRMSLTGRVVGQTEITFPITAQRVVEAQVKSRP